MPDKLKLMTIGDASEYLGVSIDTLRRWERKGKLESYRSPGGHRYFKKENLDSVFGRKYERVPETKPRMQKPLMISPVEKHDEFRVLDRPTREVKIPDMPLVRVARENLAQNSSLLTPQIQTQSSVQPSDTLPTKEAQQSKADRNTKMIVLAIIGITILGIIIYVSWKSSQTVLSPIP